MDDSIRLSEEQRKELLTVYRYGKGPSPTIRSKPDSEERSGRSDHVNIRCRIQYLYYDAIVALLSRPCRQLGTMRWSFVFSMFYGEYMSSMRYNIPSLCEVATFTATVGGIRGRE